MTKTITVCLLIIIILFVMFIRPILVKEYNYVAQEEDKNICEIQVNGTGKKRDWLSYEYGPPYVITFKRPLNAIVSSKPILKLYVLDESGKQVSLKQVENIELSGDYNEVVLEKLPLTSIHSVIKFGDIECYSVLSFRTRRYLASMMLGA